MAPDPVPAAHHAPLGVACEGVGKTFPGDVEAVAALDLQIEAGRTTALVGPSGCGKSTLLRMIAGLEQPTTGHIEIGARSPADAARNARLALAFQDPSLLPWRSVRGNIALPLALTRQQPDPERLDISYRQIRLESFATRAHDEIVRRHARTGARRCAPLESLRPCSLLDRAFRAVDELHPHAARPGKLPRRQEVPARNRTCSHVTRCGP